MSMAVEIGPMIMVGRVVARRLGEI